MTDEERLAKIKTLLQVFLAPRSTSLGPYAESHTTPHLSASQQAAYDTLCAEASAPPNEVPTNVALESRLERMREMVRILLNLPKGDPGTATIDRRRAGSAEQRAAFEELKAQAGLSAPGDGPRPLR
jgi:hypothetical protein